MFEGGFIAAIQGNTRSSVRLAIAGIGDGRLVKLFVADFGTGEQATEIVHPNGFVLITGISDPLGAIVGALNPDDDVNFSAEAAQLSQLVEPLTDEAARILDVFILRGIYPWVEPDLRRDTVKLKVINFIAEASAQVHIREQRRAMGAVEVAEKIGYLSPSSERRQLTR